MYASYLTKKEPSFLVGGGQRWEIWIIPYHNIYIMAFHKGK